MIWKKHAIARFYFLFLWVSSGLMAQMNLVPNPGFEDYRKCPRHLGNFEEDVAFWNTPTDGTTDFFHLCSEHMGTPENFNGAQKTFEGEGYAGFYAYAPGDYREYLQTRLNEPLQEGDSYEISFFVSLAERSDYAIRDFEILFSSAPVSIPLKKNFSKKHWYAITENSYHHLKIANPDYYGDTEKWVRVQTRFQARGSERFLILGNFRTNKKTPTRATRRSSNKGAYYYIDLVELRRLGGDELVSGSIRELGKKEQYSLDSLQVFRSLLFEFDTYRLTGTGEEELRSLYRFLRSDSTLHLFLGGHTDTIGIAGYNQKLSERRCRAVASYLQDQGLPPERIRWKGYGATRPVGDNTTDEGRRRNRRVEFLIQQGHPPDSEPEG